MKLYRSTWLHGEAWAILSTCGYRAGVLQVEAMAQLGGIAMMDPDNAAAQQNFFFGGIEACKFRRPVVPGDTLVSRQSL